MCLFVSCVHLLLCVVCLWWKTNKRGSSSKEKAEKKSRGERTILLFLFVHHYYYANTITTRRYQNATLPSLVHRAERIPPVAARSQFFSAAPSKPATASFFLSSFVDGYHPSIHPPDASPKQIFLITYQVRGYDVFFFFFGGSRWRRSVIFYRQWTVNYNGQHSTQPT